MTGRHAQPRAPRSRSAQLAALLGALLVAVTLLVPAPEQTEASWADAEAASATLTASTLNALPGGISCANGGETLVPTTATISWTPPANLPANSEYEMVLTKGQQSQTVYQTATNRQFVVSLLGDLLGFLLGSSGTINVQIRAVIRDTQGAVLWTAPTYTSRTITYTAPVLGLLLGGFSCS